MSQTAKAPIVELGARLSIDDLKALAHGGATPALASPAVPRIAAGRAVVERIVAAGIPAYGVTTGVGSQKDFAVDPATIAAFNDRLITAHATIAPAPRASRAGVRAALAIQLHIMASGRTGVRPVLVDALLARLQADDLPDAVLGSSSGMSDIVAMSQLSLGIIGRAGVGAGGRGAASLDGLAAKEALSLLNSNALTLGLGSLALAEARRLFAVQNLVACLSLEGFQGNAASWSEAVDQARGQPGQSAVGQRLRAALAGGALLAGGVNRLLQDPLSFRCVPQIHGAAAAALDFAWDAWERELNAIPDNPLVLWGDDAPAPFISHGNMDTTLLALTLDTLRLALARLCDAAGERIHKIQWAQFSGLPTGLAGHDCLASVRQAANPAVLNFRGQLGDGVEDVAGNAPVAVDQLEQMLAPAWNLATIEAVCAAWAIARRGIAPATLGARTGPLFTALRPLLPIGVEGEAIFDLSAARAIVIAAS
ncbi:aromatic amino acid lyase [Acidiphilium sp. 34-64-41]|uniref:aromatic amino acid lyase n=1 Tax=Acidiphilium sp. 34-64-41 TaxID=1970297 RepID=UPI002579B414|nr:aromatic amino acid lyase [Acidiphilium sp. 34-64-41]